MKTKKTRWDKRGTYTFNFNDGTNVTLRPGEDGVTEADIKVLHSLDDAEVYNNIKNSRPPLTEAEKAEAVREFLISKTRLNPAAFRVKTLEAIPKNDAGKTLYSELKKYAE